MEPTGAEFEYEVEITQESPNQSISAAQDKQTELLWLAQQQNTMAPAPQPTSTNGRTDLEPARNASNVRSLWELLPRTQVLK